MSRMNSGWIPFRSGPGSSTATDDPLQPAPEPPTTDAATSTKRSGAGANHEPKRKLNTKTSNNSLRTISAPNWLSWTKKEGDDTDEAIDDAVNEEYPSNEEDDYVPDDNGDIVEEHVSHDRKQSSSSTWTFWNNAPETNNKAKKTDTDQKAGANKPKEREENFSNTLLNTTPTLPSRADFKAAENERNSPPPSQDEAGGDDAVLYKPHDNANQFNKINTHKNENLRENIIVPSWNLCLPAQAHSSSTSLTSSLWGSASTANQTGSHTKMDLKSWRHFINQLSSKFGFSSQSLTSVVDDPDEQNQTSDDDKTDDTVQKEFNLLYEKTYRLYGRSLAKLPPHKRACLPNYNKLYTKAGVKQNQLEEDSNDLNSISITNDPMGNLLINYKPHHKQDTSVSASEIVSFKAGPLKKIKKILIIGVHGFFPTKIVRPLIGAPKGTSLKFANEAEKAVIRYCIENDLITETESNVSIQKIALEKEGKIFERVRFFTEILSKWEQELNEADFIFVASHSQGCVVSIILLAKLISLGILKDPIRKRIGILGMAGINNGPFYGADKSFLMKAYSAIEHESMNELFELTKFTSPQSLVYKESMQVIINANVKLCLIGSINDQLVPLYSSMASHIFHPNIYRACYIDYSSLTPVFIQKLVSLCCHLQNLGYFDNNVLKELSTSLAGPLTGSGHSKIYNDGKVYDLGIKFVLDTDDIVIPPTGNSKLLACEGESPYHIHGLKSGVGTYGGVEADAQNYEEIVQIPTTNQIYIKEYNVGKIGTNPFILPWCLRGLLFNIEKNWPNNNKLLTVESGKDVGKTGYDEISDLFVLFESWKPDTKVLKELKFRLNGMRASKL